MKRCVLFTLLCVLSGPALPAKAESHPLDKGESQAFAKIESHLLGEAQSFDKAGFYSAMASGNLDEINRELTIVTGTSPKEQEAYEGALLMRKAGLLSRAKEKLAAFKSGAVKLENSLAKDSGNVEYHFLRLMIQEHAPRVVHYNSDQEKDSRLITRSFPTLSPVLQKAILNYCPHSKLLNQKELNG